MKQRQFKDICPLIDAFHIPDVEGAVRKKQWLLSYRATTDGTGIAALTINTISGGLLDRFESYQVLVQEISAVPGVIVPHVNFKTTTGFEVEGDASTIFSVIVLGTEGVLGGKREGQNRSGRWAKDYCPYCKAMKFKALVGSIFTDQVSVGMSQMVNLAGTFTIDFPTLTQSTGSDTDPDTGYVTYRESGTQRHIWLSEMKDATYEIMTTPVSTPGGVVVPIVPPATVTKEGFIFAGDPASKYDVLVVGQIEQ